MTLMSIFCCYIITIRKSSTFQCSWNPLFTEDKLDIRATAKEHPNILPNLLAAHGISGCDTVAPCYGIGKVKMLKTLKQGKLSLSCLGDSNADWPDVVKQATSFMLACHGVPKLDRMT